MSAIKQHIDSLRHQRARARRNIEAAWQQISDPIDRSRYIEIQKTALAGIGIELHKLGHYDRPPIQLDAPPPRQPSRSPVVRHFDFAVTLRSLDVEERLIEGIATTPAPDRLHDVVDPLGARYELPLPLLLGHDHQSPVGEVFAAKPSSIGIAIIAKIAKLTTDGEVKRMTDRAWDLVKHKLIRSLSIGFRPLEREPLPGGSGWRFKTIEVLEVSLVTVPANAGAKITGTRAA